jgi:hypothetical protein
MLGGVYRHGDPHDGGAAMTRAERLAQQEARAKEKLRKDRKKLVQATHKRRGEEKRLRTKQQYLVGKLADDAGLLVLEASMLAGLFAQLTPLVTTPDPVATLAALMRAAAGSPGRSVEGCADLRSCGPCGASGDTVQ